MNNPLHKMDGINENTIRLVAQQSPEALNRFSGVWPQHEVDKGEGDYVVEGSFIPSFLKHEPEKEHKRQAIWKTKYRCPSCQLQICIHFREAV